MLSAWAVSMTRCSSLWTTGRASSGSSNRTRGPTGSAATALWPRSRQSRPGAGWLTTRVRSKAAGVKGRSGYFDAVSVIVQHAGSRREFDAGEIELGMDRERWRATHDQARYRQASLQQPLAQSKRARQARLRGLPPRGQVVVVDLAVVGVQAVGDEIWQPVDERIELGGRVARGDARPPHSDLEVDQDRNGSVEPVRGGRKRRAESG